MEDKNLRITTEEQVEANRVTIAAEIIRTDKNVTDIIEIKDRLNFEDLPVTEGLTGKLEDLNTTTKENLVAAINENVGRLNTNDSLDATQNIRLENIENSLSTVGSDYSTLTASGQLTQTVQIIKPTIIRNFTNDDLAVNTINPTTLELSTLIKKASTVRGEFYFTAQQLTGTIVDFELQLYNVSTSTVLDTVKAKMDFTGSIEFFSGTRTVKGDVGAGDTVVIRTFLSAGAVVTISQAGMDLSVTAKQGTISTINDTQIISTNINLGNGNVAEDIEALRILDNGKATTEDLQALDQRVQNIENANLVAGLEDLTTRVEDNEEAITNLQTKTLNIHQVIYDMTYPVSARPIVFAEANPQDSLTNGVVATWELIGTIEEGQTVIGGSSSNGSVKSHDHLTVVRGGGTSKIDTTYNDNQDRVFSYDSGAVGTNNEEYVLTTKRGDRTNPDAGRSSSTGGSQNKAWGLGIGTGVNVYRRVS